MHSIIKFYPDFIDRFYCYLKDDARSRKAFGCCCRQFKQIFCENEKFLEIEEFISKNYVPCAVNLDNLPLWRQLKKTNIILVGESHAVSWHREAFAGLVHRIWLKEKWALLTEGGGKWAIGTGQIKYIKEEIAELSETWDIKNPDFSPHASKLFINILWYTQLFLELCDTTNHRRWIKRVEIVLTCLNNSGSKTEAIVAGVERMKLFWDFYKQAEDKLSATESMIFYKTEKAFALVEVGKLIYSLIDRDEEELQNLIDGTLLQRDQEMVLNLENQVESGKKVVVIAGSHHVILRDNSPLDLLRKRGNPCLSLVPKENAHKSKVKEGEKIPPREQLKTCRVPYATQVSWDDLHHYGALNPIQVVFDEVNACIEAAKQFHALAKEIGAADQDTANAT